MINNTGNFGAAAGGLTPALQAAIQRRADQGGVTSQVTNTAPTAQPLPTVPATPSPQMISNAPTSNVEGQGRVTERTDDAHIILTAMANRLKSQEKIAEANLIPPKPIIGGV